MEKESIRQIIENKIREMLERPCLKPKDIHELAAAYKELTKDDGIKDVGSSCNKPSSMLNSCTATADPEVTKNTTAWS